MAGEWAEWMGWDTKDIEIRLSFYDMISALWALTERGVRDFGMVMIPSAPSAEPSGTIQYDW